MRASDVMTGNVISVTPDMTIREVARLFVEKRISGAPVLDPDGSVVGMRALSCGAAKSAPTSAGACRGWISGPQATRRATT